MHVVVLAAGASSRFGAPKQLADIGGRSMLSTVVACATELAADGVIVVLGANAAAVRASLGDTTATIVINDRHAEGMASSLRAGLGHLPAQADGVLVLLGDQAAVTTHDLRRLTERWKQDPQRIVAARYGEVVGVPAIFPADLLPELLQLTGDSGARSLLSRHRDRVVAEPMLSAAVDIDTAEDLRRLRDATPR